ncbi:hypothetical protein CgunFtcFv8_017337 [Champsocephalus gunnari]|uniref:Alcohol dehydrogenase-like C-terminal domain-containing protein n=1 Tax=Champsocephalus gunnari TaxID=52237 RepID=A0AAN8DKY5_CHAGU|nr:hypothetical protein CgunFtcFv8_017337 [Champsocephalus gunnari]
MCQPQRSCQDHPGGSAGHNKRGVDYALECVGSPVVMNSAFESTTDAWGTCVIVGWSESEAINIRVEKILMGRTLKGTYFGDWKSVEDVPKLG